MNLYSIWTGPTIINQIADRLAARGFKVHTSGTEHVYAYAESIQELLDVLPTWTYRDIHCLTQGSVYARINH